jgi:hypothetical protein
MFKPRGSPGLFFSARHARANPNTRHKIADSDLDSALHDGSIERIRSLSACVWDCRSARRSRIHQLSNGASIGR